VLYVVLPFGLAYMKCIICNAVQDVCFQVLGSCVLCQDVQMFVNSDVN